jgi:hypothetical protein
MEANASLTYKKHELHRSPNKAQNRGRIQEHFNDFCVLRHGLKKWVDPSEVLCRLAFPLLFLKVVGLILQVKKRGTGKRCFLFWLEPLLEIVQDQFEAVIDGRHALNGAVTRATDVRHQSRQR